MATHIGSRSRVILVAGLLAATMALAPGCVSRGDDDRAGGQAVDVPESLPNDLAPLARAADAESMLARARERGLSVQDERVLVDVQTRDLAAEDRNDLAIEGVEVISFSAKYQRVSAAVADPAALRALARVAVVRRVDPEYGYAQ